MNYILGASMLIDGTFLSRAGHMRDDYFLYCEEVEWCLRARAAWSPDRLCPEFKGLPRPRRHDRFGRAR